MYIEYLQCINVEFRSIEVPQLSPFMSVRRLMSSYSVEIVLKCQCRYRSVAH
jgi:hypothetical protein